MESINVAINDTPEDKQEDEYEDDISHQHTDIPVDVLPKVVGIVS